jgi:hypothetical protein
MSSILTVFKGKVDISAEKAKDTAKMLADLIKPKVLTVLEQLKQGTFPASNYPFEKVMNSGLTGLAGVYLIVNQKTMKIYLGGASDLAQRKGDHKRNFTDPGRLQKVSPALREDLASGSFQDFCFVPLLGFSRNNVLGLTQTHTLNQEIVSFLDTEVESLLLEELIGVDSKIKQYFYNTKTIGKFQEGNTYGGAPQSGTQDRPLSFENYAWESVKAAATSLDCDRKMIRLKRGAGIVKEISPEEYTAFTGIRISNKEAATFFNGKEEELLVLRQKLGFKRKT